MGCCFSSSMEDSSESDQSQPPSHMEDDEVPFSELKIDGVWPFTEFVFSDLDTATKNFSSDEIVSENAEESSNVVYKGHLEKFGVIAVKKFKNGAWPEPNQFAEEAKRIGELKHKRVVNLIGYCCDGDQRLLVAQLLPNDTLAKRLFHEKSQTMDWEMRLGVAYCVAEALEYCASAGFASYTNLSPYSVLFDEEGDACLSCFGLMKEKMDDQTTTGSVNSESVTYRFGTILLNLLTGKQTPPSHAPEMIDGKNVIELMDPNLEGNFSADEATIVLKLASQCLLSNDRDSIGIKELVATLETLQSKTEHEEEASYSSQQQQLESLQTQTEVLSDEIHEGALASQLMSLEEAFSRMDLDAIHKHLVMAKCEDDKEFAELSLEELLPEMDVVDMVGKIADDAFEKKKFEDAINCYFEIIEAKNVVVPSVFARRCLSYLFVNNLEAAHLDAIQATEKYPNWPTGYFLMSVVLAKADMPAESAEQFNNATDLLEAKRQSTIVSEES